MVVEDVAVVVVILVVGRLFGIVFDDETVNVEGLVVEPAIFC